MFYFQPSPVRHSFFFLPFLKFKFYRVNSKLYYFIFRDSIHLTLAISLVASTSFSQRFQIGILRFTDASKLSFFGTAIPLRFRAIPVAPDSDSDSEAGIEAPVPLPCNVGNNKYVGIMESMPSTRNF